MRPITWDDWSTSPRLVALNRRRLAASGTCVVYWVQNAQRGVDNEALNAAIALANARGVGVLAYFALHAGIPHATHRSYAFLIDGLRDLAGSLRYRGVSFTARYENPLSALPQLIAEAGALAVVTDRSALRFGRSLRQSLAGRLAIPFYEVDSEHVVPLHVIGKAHSAARTLRPVLLRDLDAWLWPRFDPSPQKQTEAPEGIDLSQSTRRLLEVLSLDRSVKPVRGVSGGTCEAMRRLGAFQALQSGARTPSWYESHTRLSSYLRYGHIAPAAVVRALRDDTSERARRIMEEVLVRRELASNFTWYTPRYWTTAGTPVWAVDSLTQHREDRPPAAYSREQLIHAETDDPVWNAAQHELVQTGRIQSYVRMYWGKRLVEWFADPAEGLRLALWLNDHYALDGRSPNGVANIQWCFGLHDRPFPERPMLGLVRPLGTGGVKRNIDLNGYVEWVRTLAA